VLGWWSRWRRASEWGGILPGVGSVSPPELVDYRARLVRAGLAAYADQLVALARPSVRLRPEAAAEETLPVGASRIGGRPDVPQGVSMADGRRPAAELHGTGEPR